MKTLANIMQTAADIAAKKQAEKKAEKPPVDKAKSGRFLNALTGKKYQH